MRLQSAQNTCGPASVANALQCLGPKWAKVTEDAVTKKIRLGSTIADTDPGAGTVESQVIKALAAYKVKAEELTIHSPHAAICALRGHLAVGRPALLCVDGDQHWLTVCGLLGASFLVADSADSELVTVYEEERLADRWKTPGDPPTYYGLILHRKGKS